MTRAIWPLSIQIHEQHDGMHPSEAMVCVGDPQRWAFADRGSIQDGRLNVAGLFAHTETHGLVQLPQEATDGSHRIWVKAEDVHHG